MSKIEELTGSYLAAVDTLTHSVRGMSAEQLKARPVAGKWSTQEVICHIADFDPIIVDRMKRVITHDRPMLLGADEGLFAKGLAYGERNVEEELALIALTRQHMARVLRTLPDSALERIGVHNERGERSLADLLNGATQHILGHVHHIEEKRKALGL